MGGQIGSNGGVHRRGISNTATLLLAFDNSVTLVYQRLPLMRVFFFLALLATFLTIATA